MQDEKPGVKFSTVMGVMIAFSNPLRALLCKPNTVGKRLLLHPIGVGVSIGAPLVWAAMCDSVWMWGVLLLSLLGLATQARSKGHSFAIGDSRWGEKADVCVLFLSGSGLCYADPLAGGYVLAVGVCDAAARWWCHHKTENQDQDVIDGMTEAKARASRVRNRGF